MNYLSSAEILYIHSRVVSEIGGRGGINDVRVLKRAVSYIKNNEIFPNIFDKAGAMIFAIAKKKPFASGNLQTAVISVLTFLKMNKKELDISKSSAFEFLEDKLSFSSVKDISGWLSKNSL